MSTKNVGSFIVSVFLFTILLFFGNKGVAQVQQEFVKISKSQDLTGGSVTSIIQDKNGFIWIGTKSGLSRYDGSTFKVYSQQMGGLSADDVSSVFVDSKNRMWVGTINGLNLFDFTHDRFISFKHQQGNEKSLSSNEINTIFEASDKSIWVGTENGLNKFVDTDSSFVPYTSSKADVSTLSHNSVKSIVEDARGDLWIGTFGGGLNRFSRKTRKFHHYPQNLEGENTLAPGFIYVVNTLNAEELLIGTSGEGLLSFNISSGSFSPFFKNPEQDRFRKMPIIRSIFKSNENNIWIGTDGDGLLKISKPEAEVPQLTQFTKDNQVQGSLSSNAIYSIFVDSDSNVWVGTAWNGINILEKKESAIQHYYSDFKGINPSPVLSIFKEPGRLWFGTDGVGLNIFNASNGTVSRLSKEQIRGDYIQFIKKRKAGGYYLGTFANGLILFDPEKGVIGQYKYQLNDKGSLGYNDVREVIEEGDDFWVASWGGGLSYFDHRTQKFKTIRSDANDPSSLSSDNVTSLAEAPGGKMWVGTFGGGLNLFDPSTGIFSHFESEKEREKTISSNNILNLLKDSKGRLWIGTWDQGLGRMDLPEHKVLRFSEKNGLREKTIIALVEDHKGNVWVSTKNGIYKYEDKSGFFKRYPDLDGEYRINSVFKDEDRLYFGTNEGVVAFKPDELEDFKEETPIVFTGLKLFNKELGIGEEGVLDQHILHENFIELKHNHSVVTFEFSALKYPFSRYEYAIKLENFDQDWREIGTQRSATFTNLAPGDYTFKVKARIPGGSWGEEYKEINVLVHKPFWKTWWAYLAYAFIFSFLLYLFYLYSIQWEKLKTNLRVEKITREKEQELSKLKLKFFTDVSHEIRTPVTLMMGAVNRIAEENGSKKSSEAVQQIKKNGNHLLHLVNELLDFRRLESSGIKLKAARGNFVKFVKEIYLSFSTHAANLQINYQFVAEKEDVPLWFDRDQMEKVIYNLLTNAFKFTSIGGSIKVEVVQDDQNVLLIVEDTGRGIPEKKLKKIFKRFYQNDSDPAQQKEDGFGIGLSIAKGIVKLHSGQIFVESEVNKGSKFVVKLLPGADHFLPHQIVESFKDSESLDNYVMDGPDKNSEQILTDGFANSTVLIVEDNEGIRNYLVQFLQPLFKVVAAPNGKEALEIATTQIPDLVISDVMMPEMDGISLTMRLKKDIRTSHIPVILLTARTSLVYKKEGLETGADDYVTKPFSESLLKARIINLLKNRQLLREKFQLEMATEPKDIAISSPDQEFLEALTKVIEENLGNPDLKAEIIAREIGISHSVIYKKIKSLTGLSLVEFIRDYRLKVAAQLLKKHDLPVVDICLRVGFSDRKYFSQVFKKRFGSSPSEYSKNCNKDTFTA